MFENIVLAKRLLTLKIITEFPCAFGRGPCDRFALPVVHNKE